MDSTNDRWMDGWLAGWLVGVPNYIVTLDLCLCMCSNGCLCACMHACVCVSVLLKPWRERDWRRHFINLYIHTIHTNTCTHTLCTLPFSSAQERHNRLCLMLVCVRVHSYTIVTIYSQSMYLYTHDGIFESNTYIKQTCIYTNLSGANCSQHLNRVLSHIHAQNSHHILIFVHTHKQIWVSMSAEQRARER